MAKRRALSGYLVSVRTPDGRRLDGVAFGRTLAAATAHAQRVWSREGYEVTGVRRLSVAQVKEVRETGRLPLPNPRRRAARGRRAAPKRRGKARRNAGRFVTAKVGGRTYQIPEMWLVGMQRGGYTVPQAVAYWHEQELMEEEATRRKGNPRARRRRRAALTPKRHHRTVRRAAARRAPLQRTRKRNPTLAILGGNPTRRRSARRAARATRAASVPLGRATQLEYTHDRDGRRYYHRFGSGVRVALQKDGSVTIRHPQKKLWKMFAAN